MNVLTHCYVSHEVIKGRKLTADEEALLFVGSFISDVSEFRLVPTEETHRRSLAFLKSLDKKFYYFGLGVVLHGEEPEGLDFYAHRHYIPVKEKEILKIIDFYKKVFSHETDMNKMAHIIIEFCFEHLTAEKNTFIVDKVGRAVGNPVLIKAIYNLANFFDINKRYTKKILKLPDHLEKFVYNFKTLKGTAHNFQKFIFLKQFRDAAGQKKGFWNRLTASSLIFLKSRFKQKQVEQMFARCIEFLRKDYEPFTRQSIEKIKKMVKEKDL